MGIIRFFDKLEDKVRGRLSRSPIPYGIIGGISIVLFWRGIWHSADIIESMGGYFAFLFSAPVSTFLSAVILLMTGLFVSFFIGDRIILSGLTHEKKLEEKTETEVRAEGALIVDIHKRIQKIEGDIAVFKEKIK